MKSVLVKPVPPFRLDLSVWALRRSPANIMDRWDGRVYRRVLVTGNRAAAIAVVQEGSPDSPEVRISWEGAGISMGHREEVLMTVRKMLSLDVDLSDFYRLASAHHSIAELAGRFAGLKPPRLPTVFEALINGFACQQLSLNVCILLLNRLCNAYGLSVNGESAFPRPSDLAGLESTDLMKLGFSGRKAEYILNVSAGIAGGKMEMESLKDSDDDAILSFLLGLRGIWTLDGRVRHAPGAGPS